MRGRSAGTVRRHDGPDGLQWVPGLLTRGLYYEWAPGCGSGRAWNLAQVALKKTAAFADGTNTGPNTLDLRPDSGASLEAMTRVAGSNENEKVKATVTPEAWLVICVLLLCFSMLALNRFAPDIIMMGGLTLLLISGVLTPAEALAGLANEGMVTVGILYVVVTGIRETGGIAWIVHSLLGQPRSLGDAQLKLMAPVAALSAFLNNTPVVAIFIPAVQDWAKRHRLAVSKLMIPLSFAAIAGGTCTLIGTSTNLVVHGLLIAETDFPRLGMFDIAWLGVPTIVIVMVFILVFGKWVLPERRTFISQFEDAREFSVEMLVEPESALVGKTIEDAGLRQLPGMYLVEIDRAGRILPAVSPQERLHGGDRLIFAGIAESVVDLKKIRGLAPATDHAFKLDTKGGERCLTEVVVASNCPLIGKGIREGRFRSHYNAAIIGVARNGARINKKVGDIVLRPGDTLLLESDPSFIDRQRNSRDFLLVSRLDDSRPVRHERAPIALAIVFFMVAIVAMGWLSMLEAAMLAAGLMLIAGCTSGGAARRAVDWQVLIVIAASFGFGSALRTTGAAEAVAESLVALSLGAPLAALGAIFVATALMTALATNNAAAVVMFPIAIATAQSLEVNALPFVMTIMIAASASFATPIGYQTNLMVYGPGGYRFTDYAGIGIPLTVLVGLMTVVVAPLVWPL